MSPSVNLYTSARAEDSLIEINFTENSGAKGMRENFEGFKTSDYTTNMKESGSNSKRVGRANSTGSRE
jgi:hypothetical protein